ncbi:7206_t:CDS:2, partial [Funneliformis mosseae]
EQPALNLVAEQSTPSTAVVKPPALSIIKPSASIVVEPLAPN